MARRSMVRWVFSSGLLGVLALVSCGKSCSFNCGGGGGAGSGSAFMLLELCINADPSTVGTNQFPATASFTGTMGAGSGAATFTATANGMITPTVNQPQCISTQVYGQQVGTWSVTANPIAGTPARGPLGPCSVTNPGTGVFDISTGQNQCRNSPF